MIRNEYIDKYLKRERGESTQKTVDNSYSPRYNEDSKTTAYDVNDAWKKSNEKALRYAGDSAWNELTGHLSAENKGLYLKKARPLQEFVDAKDAFDYKRNNYTTTKNSTQRFDEAVQRVQRMLNEKGYTDKFGQKLKEDGIFAGKTSYAYDKMMDDESRARDVSQPTVTALAQPASAQTTAESGNSTRTALTRYHEQPVVSRSGTRERSTANNTQNSSEYNKRIEENAKLNGKSVAKIEKSSEIISRNADVIKAAGKKYGVNPAIIAACIYSEQILNYNITDIVRDKMYWDNPTVGIGQVSIETAKTIENYGRIEKIEHVGKKEDWHGNNSVAVDCWNVPGVGLVEGSYEYAMSKRLENEEQCVEFVAAYLQLIQDLWREAYPMIDGKSDILATLYNIGERGGEKGIHSNPESSPFGDTAKDNYYHMQYLLGIE